MTKRQADALLRKDLRKFCAIFRKFGRDSLLLGTLAYNVGYIRFLGYTPETEALLEQERQEVIVAHKAWQARQSATS